MFRSAAAITAAVLTVIAPARVETEDIPRFESQVAAVHQTVSVYDSDAKCFVNGLTRDDFMVRENGTPQSITRFSQEHLPVRVSLMLDMSVSTEPYLDDIRTAAKRFVRSLSFRDMVQVVLFHRHSFVLQDFTNDRILLESAIDEGLESEETALYTALHDALFELQGLEEPGEMMFRKAIIILTDGLDTMSYIDSERVLGLAASSDISVYPVMITGPKHFSENGHVPESMLSNEDLAAHQFLARLTQVTGGRLFEPRSVSSLGAAYENIAREVSVLYAITYETDRPLDGTFRYLTVQVPGRIGLLIRHRSGYLAVPKH